MPVPRIEARYSSERNFWTDLKGLVCRPISGKAAGSSFLCDLIGVKCPPPDDLHYQFFDRTASAIIEAERFKADDAAIRGLTSAIQIRPERNQVRFWLTGHADLQAGVDVRFRDRTSSQ